MIKGSRQMGAALGVFGFVLAGMATPALALDLNWSGQFRAEAHFVRNYSLDSTETGLLVDATRAGQGGYYIRGGGEHDVQFQTLFLRLRPSIVVNDNIYIKTEWWVNDPVFGFFGNAYPYSVDQRQWYSSQSRGSIITAQRFWAEFLSDIGTVQVGRAPLDWGLGVVWNSGDDTWDRYHSTGDVIRIVSKLGAFSVTPSIAKYSGGNSIGGACFFSGSTCTVVPGNGTVSDYSLSVKYDNPDEEFEGGVLYIKRLAGAAQDPTSGILGPGGLNDAGQVTAGMNYNIWDLYGRRKFGDVTLGAEVPITSGEVASLPYDTFGVALEADWKITDSWETWLRAGRAAGQPGTLDRLRAFYFHPSYRLGLILFNYQLANFAGPHTLNDPAANASNLVSPFDNPIVNAHYLSLGGALQFSKWKVRTAWTLANALEAANAGAAFFNTWDRKFYNNNAGVAQEAFLGWEMDYGATFQWDDAFQVDLDFGWFFPGGFFKFANVANVENQTSSVFALLLRAGVTF